MPDPICRWRNPFVPTVVALIDFLPKEELSKQRARQIVEQKVQGTAYHHFYTTAYQLASQLGLYYETGERYFPKFTFIPTEDEVKSYLTNWIIHYSVPNPYTDGFPNIVPLSIHAAICTRLYGAKNPLNWELVKQTIFGQAIGNNDILKNAINNYSPILSIANGLVSLKQNNDYEDLLQYTNVDISNDRNNKEYFFDLFPVKVENKSAGSSTIVELGTQLTQQDVGLIDELQQLQNLTQTEKDQIIKARIGQGVFRRNLIQECNYCPLTLVDDSKLLIASHIKPWRNANNAERIDPKNGLLLTPTFDRLFDAGLISFENDKTLMISPLLSETNIQKLQLEAGKEYPQLPIIGRETFLEYHRNAVLKK